MQESEHCLRDIPGIFVDKGNSAKAEQKDNQTFRQLQRRYRTNSGETAKPSRFGLRQSRWCHVLHHNIHIIFLAGAAIARRTKTLGHVSAEC